MHIRHCKEEKKKKANRGKKLKVNNRQNNPNQRDKRNSLYGSSKNIIKNVENANKLYLLNMMQHFH